MGSVATHKAFCLEEHKAFCLQVGKKALHLRIVGTHHARRNTLTPKSRQRNGTLAKPRSAKLRNAQRLETEQLQKRTDDGGDDMSNDFDDSLTAEVSIAVLKSFDNSVPYQKMITTLVIRSFHNRLCYQTDC